MLEDAIRESIAPPAIDPAVILGHMHLICKVIPIIRLLGISPPKELTLFRLRRLRLFHSAHPSLGKDTVFATGCNLTHVRLPDT